MPDPSFASPTLWALALVALVALAALGYTLYQVRGYRLLRRQYARLRDFRQGQRQVYRGLETCQGCLEALSVRVPHAPRPAPYGEDDARAIALRGELASTLEGLQQALRPLQLGSEPRLSAIRLFTHRYRMELKACEQELAFVKSLRRGLADAEVLVDELEAVLSRLADKHLEVLAALDDLHGTAEALNQEIELERRAGTEGLVSLVFEARAVQTQAMEWGERLRSAAAMETAQVAIKAEAERVKLAIRLNDLYRQVGSIAGIHDHADRGLERLDAAIEAAEQRLAGLRQEVAAVLEPEMQALQQERQALRARYQQRDLNAYEAVAREAWALVARVRLLDQSYLQICEADERAGSLAEGCAGALDELEHRLAGEETASGARMDLSREALARAREYMGEVQRLWAGGPEHELPADHESLISVLSQVETLAAACRQEVGLGTEMLATWQTQSSRVKAVLARVHALADDQARVAGIWQALSAYDPSNWAQIDAGWHELYCRERKALLASAAEVEQQCEGGMLRQSGGAELQQHCEKLDQRRDVLRHEAQHVAAALASAKDAEREVREGLSVLRDDVDAVAAIGGDLALDLPAAAELRDLTRGILASFRELQDEAGHPERADLFRLRDESIPHVHELLAMHKLSHAQLLDNERAALKRDLAGLLERWESLRQRLAKSSPATDVDCAALEQQWDGLVRAVRAAQLALKQVLDLHVQVAAFAEDMDQAEQLFQAERETVHQAEIGLARERRSAAQVRESLPKLLTHPHPQVVNEEWERSTKAWRKGEQLVRRLESQHGVSVYLSRLAEAASQYEEARVRAHSALVRILRYAFLEDPDGMHDACTPLGRSWGKLGVTAREAHIRELLADLERAGQLQRLVDRVGGYFAGREDAAG